MSYPPYQPPSPQQPGQPHPQSSVTKYRKRTNHTFHLIVCLCTCFAWLPVWMCVWAWNAWGPKATATTRHQ